MKIPLSQAHTYLSAVSRSKTYADEAAGVLTATKDPSRGNQKVVDIAELERVYGKVRDPKENPQDSETDSTGSQIDVETLIQSYENRIRDLQEHLRKSNDREDKLISLSDRIQKQNEVLMLPNSEQAERKDKGWLLRLVGAR